MKEATAIITKLNTVPSHFHTILRNFVASISLTSDPPHFLFTFFRFCYVFQHKYTIAEVINNVQFFFSTLFSLVVSLVSHQLAKVKVLSSFFNQICCCLRHLLHNPFRSLMQFSSIIHISQDSTRGKLNVVDVVIVVAFP